MFSQLLACRRKSTSTYWAACKPPLTWIKTWSTSSFICFCLRSISSGRGRASHSFSEALLEGKVV